MAKYKHKSKLQKQISCIVYASVGDHYLCASPYLLQLNLLSFRHTGCVLKNPKKKKIFFIFFTVKNSDIEGIIMEF